MDHAHSDSGIESEVLDDASGGELRCGPLKRFNDAIGEALREHGRQRLVVGTIDRERHALGRREQLRHLAPAGTLHVNISQREELNAIRDVGRVGGEAEVHEELLVVVEVGQVYGDGHDLLVYLLLDDCRQHDVVDWQTELQDEDVDDLLCKADDVVGQPTYPVAR